MFFLEATFWLSLFSVTLIQIALGADNLIIITIIANKLPAAERKKAINIGLVLAAVFRIMLLFVVTYVLKYATTVFYHFDWHLPSSIEVSGGLSGKAIILSVGGIFLIWKGVAELRHKIKNVEQELKPAGRLKEVIALIVGINLLFSVDSILTIVGMTDFFSVMAGSVVISVALMLAFVGPISSFISNNPDFEILGLFVLLLIGFVLFLEGGHVAHLTINSSTFPYIPQWIVIFMLLFMFAVDFYQNWLDRRNEQAPVILRRRKK